MGAKTYHHQDFKINFPNNHDGSTITNFAVTVDQDKADHNRTSWAIAFDTHNKNQDVDYSFQGSLNVYFETVDNAPVPMPGGGILVITGWRDGCYYGDLSHRQYQGSFGIPYTDFLELADHVEVKAIWHGSGLGAC